jgi:sec-independent protein translocase protein TatC
MKTTNNNSQMPFWNHVDELRSRVIKSLATVIIFSLVAYFFSDIFLQILSQPDIDIMDKVNLQVLKVTSMFMIKIYISLVIGLMFSIPVILYQVWKFVSPAIDQKLNFITLLMFMMSTVFFISGAYFSYKTIIPLSITFFTSLTSQAVPVDYNITLENYLTYVVWMVFVGGLIFQLPIISIIFKRLGLIDHHLLRKGRRYSFLGIFIFAAVLTPPDPFSQLLFSVPLIVLYEISIVIIRFMK